MKVDDAQGSSANIDRQVDKSGGRSNVMDSMVANGQKISDRDKVEERWMRRGEGEDTVRIDT